MAELQQGGEGPREGEEGAQRAGGDDGAPSDAPGEAPAPSPPPPPVLIVDRPPDRPVVVAIDPTTATLQWSAPTITVQASDMRIVECLLNYELNMQQLEGDSSSAQPATIKAERWSVQVWRGTWEAPRLCGGRALDARACLVRCACSTLARRRTCK